MKKVFFHLDMDAFFASCIENKYKQYKNKPLVVGSKNSKSIISAASYAAREKGVKSGMPLFEAHKKIKKDELIIITPDFKLFKDISMKVWEVINRFTNKFEIASIDECFIDVTNLIDKYGTAKNLAILIQSEIYKETNQTCSIGISFNKLFAKIGSDLNKPNGISEITKDNFKQIVWTLPIEKIWGIGKSMANKLKGMNIHSTFDLVNANQNQIEELFGLSGRKIMQSLLGQSNDELKLDDVSNKSYGMEITFYDGKVNIIELEEILLSMAVQLVNKIIKEEKVIKTVSLIVRYRESTQFEFNKQKQQKQRKTIQQTLLEYTNDIEIIYSKLISIFEENYQDNREIVLLGLSLSSIKKTSEIGIQMSLEDVLVNNNLLISNDLSKNRNKEAFKTNIIEKEIDRREGKFYKDSFKK